MLLDHQHHVLLIKGLLIKAVSAHLENTSYIPNHYIISLYCKLWFTIQTIYHDRR